MLYVYVAIVNSLYIVAQNNGSFNENCYYYSHIMLYTHAYWTSVVCHWFCMDVCVLYAYICVSDLKHSLGHVNKLIDTSQQIKYNLTTNHLEQWTINQLYMQWCAHNATERTQ